MTDLNPFLKKLISSAGLSAYEDPTRKLIEEAWRPLTDELRVSRVGSLYGLKRGKLTPRPEPCPSILLAAHMDAVGLMVTGLVGEFLRVTEIGGLDPRVLPGQLVTVHGRQDLPGVLVQPPDHLLPEDLSGKPIPLEYLLVDTGLPARSLARLAQVGDPISFAQEPLQLGEDTIAGHSLDDRAAVAVLTGCLDQLQSRLHTWDVWAVATVQEEETFAGALTSSFELHPDLAIAVDVTFAKGVNDSGEYRVFPMGEGVTIAWGPNIHSGLHRKIKEVAEKFEIPHNFETTPKHSGTDAFAMQIAHAGIPTAVLGIPLRYMHTVVEVVSMKDIARAGRLLAEFITQLTPDFMQELSWDEDKKDQVL